MVGGVSGPRPIVGQLHTKPDACRSPESFGKANSHVGGNTSMAVDETGKSSSADAERFCPIRDGQAKRFQAIEADRQAGRGGFFMGILSFKSVVVGQLHIVGVTNRRTNRENRR